MKVSVTNGIENSGAFFQILFDTFFDIVYIGVLTLVIDIIFCTEFLCMELKKLLNV